MVQLQSLIDEFKDKTGVPAVIAAIVQADQVIDVAATGTRRRDQPDNAATVDDRLHIGSCGKALTAVLYARLVEAGLAEWGTPLAALFPDLAHAHDGWNTVTVDDLLRARAGLAPNLSPPQMLAAWKSTDPVDKQRTELASRALSKAPDNPGKFRYSNLGYMLAGAAIDRIAGEPYEIALATHVLDPLGIESLGFGPPAAMCGHKPKFQLGPLMIGSGRPALPGDAKSDNPLVISPAGCMHLTIEDWAAFMQVFLNEGSPLLTSETLRHLIELPTDQPGSMAMGWGSGEGLDGSIAMQGSNTMWAATALLDKDMKRAALVVTNDGRMTTLRKSAMLVRRILE